jgi:hypothetical protein
MSRSRARGYITAGIIGVHRRSAELWDTTTSIDCPCARNSRNAQEPGLLIEQVWDITCTEARIHPSDREKAIA